VPTSHVNLNFICVSSSGAPATSSTTLVGKRDQPEPLGVAAGTSASEQELEQMMPPSTNKRARMKYEQTGAPLFALLRVSALLLTKLSQYVTHVTSRHQGR